MLSKIPLKRKERNVLLKQAGCTNTRGNLHDTVIGNYPHVQLLEISKQSASLKKEVGYKHTSICTVSLVVERKVYIIKRVALNQGSSARRRASVC